MVLIVIAGAIGCPSPTPSPVPPNPPAPPQPPSPIVPLDNENDGKPKRLALLVGVNRYEDPLNDLDFCVQDMQALHWALTRYGGYKPEDVKLFVDTGSPQDRPTKKSVVEWMQRYWGNLKKSDTVLFVFSGHGLSKNGEAYLIPSDANPYTPSKDALRVEQVYESLNAPGAGHLFFDRRRLSQRPS